MKIVNMTPHVVNVGDKTFEPSGEIARCEEVKGTETQLAGVPYYDGFHYADSDLPSEEEGIFYIVSLPVALVERDNRSDLLISVGQIRDEKGRIVGAKALARL